MKFIFKLILLFLFVPLLGIGQTKQKDLEQRKKALLEQIKQMSALRQQQSQQRKSTIQQIEEANEKILIRTRLIQINQQQANLLSKEIADNEDQLRNLKKELIYHKDEYAKIIVSHTGASRHKTDCFFCCRQRAFRRPTSDCRI